VTQAVDGDNGIIELIISGGLAPYQVVWNTGDTGEILNSIGQGSYNALITDSFGCTATVDASVIDLWVNSNNASNWIFSEGHWRLSWGIILSYQIIDSTGRLVVQRGSTTPSIPVNGLSHGCYILRAISDQGIHTITFSVHH